VGKSCNFTCVGKQDNTEVSFALIYPSTHAVYCRELHSYTHYSTVRLPVEVRSSRLYSFPLSLLGSLNAGAGLPTAGIGAACTTAGAAAASTPPAAAVPTDFTNPARDWLGAADMKKASAELASATALTTKIEARMMLQVTTGAAVSQDLQRKVAVDQTVQMQN
jgi:hypothetical protein